tara:strand:- start:392 stop:493 length:102 start_codon:yes stop_codon:yes gene_type:complete
MVDGVATLAALLPETSEPVGGFKQVKLAETAMG